MKRNLKLKFSIAAFACLFLLPNGINANEQKDVICVNAQILCANGKGTNYSGCGTLEEVIEDLEVVYDHFCISDSER